MTENDYIEQRDGGYWIRGMSVSLDSIVRLYLEGLSPESIRSDWFPALRLEQVYGAINYYLHEHADLDPHPHELNQEYESFRNHVRSEFAEAHSRVNAILQITQAIKS